MAVMWWIPSSCITGLRLESGCAHNYISEREDRPVPVDPTGDDLKRFLAEDIGGPVVMLNMLRFKEGKRAKYEEYARAIRPFLEKHDAKVLYVGDCSTSLVAPEEHRWDTILIVRYPSRQ